MGNGFEKVIGYSAIKNELAQIIDMIKNPDLYEEMGASLPHGVMLWGAPGLGKTLTAESFISESHLPCRRIRRTKGSGDEFVDMITDTFEKAGESGPCIIFLDDLDKFANEDEDHRDAEPYVAVQAGMDSVKEKRILVLATVNQMDKLPQSLLRAGRFDCKIHFDEPTAADALEIVRYYLRDKKVDESVNLDDVTKMMGSHSCADLESLLNVAAANAAFRRHDKIQMDDIINAVLKREYYLSDDMNKRSADEIRKNAIHEAGHLVASEVLMDGSVGLASVSTNENDSLGGFVRPCMDVKRRPYLVIITLAGKAAAEMYSAETVASGCVSDISRAANMISDGIRKNATLGFSLVHSGSNSEMMLYNQEMAVHNELEHYLMKTKDLLLKNRDFLEKVTEALIAKGTLVASEIKAIKDSVKITPVMV